MLYYLNEFKNAALWPAHMAADIATHLLDPFDVSKSTAYGRLLKASAETLERSTRIYEKPSFGLLETQRDGQKVSVVEQETDKKAFCRLFSFERFADDDVTQADLDSDPIVLLVAPLSGHYATLLRDTAKSMMTHHRVYMTDWLDAKNVPLRDGEFTLESYVDYLLDFVRTLYVKHKGRRLHMMAVCQPAVPVLMAVSLLALYDEPCQPLSMTLMGGPINTRLNPGPVNDFALRHDITWFRKNILSRVPGFYKGAGRMVCPGFVLLSGFMQLNLQRHQRAPHELFKHLVRGDMEGADAHRAFYDEYRSVLDVPGEYFLDSIYHAFQKHSLPDGHMTWRGHPIQPEVITRTALMTVEGELDDISCPGQTFAAHELCRSLSAAQRDHYFQEGVGHYGIFNGRRWRTFIQPKIKDFMRTHDV